MSAMTKNPTKKELPKATTSMKTTMTTDQHRVPTICLVRCSLFHCTSCFVLSALFGLYGVAATSLIGLHDRVLVSAVSPFFKGSDVNPLFNCYTVKFLHVGLRVSVFVHALLVLLVLEVALHDRSANVFVRGILVVSCVLEFL